MKNIKLSILLSSLFVSSLFANDVSQPETVSGYTIADNITISGEVRPRYELSDYDVDGIDTIHNFSNRLVLNADWEISKNLNLDVSFLNVSSASNISSSDIEKSLTEDKDETTMPIFSLRYEFKNSNTIISAGRQRLSFNNERHLGTENWKQSYRTYESVYLKNNSIENLILEMAYSVKDTDLNIDKSLIALNARYNFFSDNTEKLNISIYDFMVEDISSSYGIILEGNNYIQNYGIHYRAEYSFQTEPTLGSNNLDSNPNLYSFDIGFRTSDFEVDLGYTVQELGYETPFGSKHNFNGSSDLSFTNSDIDTLDLSVAYNFNERSKLKGKILNFDSSSTNEQIGNEFDIDYTLEIAKNLNILTAISFFSGSNGYIDTTNAWVQLDYKF